MSPGRTPSRPRSESISPSVDIATEDPRRSKDRSADIVLIEIAKLQSDGDYTKRDLGEMRTDMRDLRDRMSKLEVRVDHLPSKGFIVGVVIAALTVVGALLSIAPKLQSLAGTAPVSIVQAVPPPASLPVPPPAPNSN